MAGEFEDIRMRLESISEELADLAIVRLRESIDAGGHELPVDERRLTRARRAVEKAISVLREPDDFSRLNPAGGGFDRVLAQQHRQGRVTERDEAVLTGDARHRVRESRCRRAWRARPR